MQTKEAAKGRWEEIYSHYGVQIRPGKHQQCPICERKGSSGINIHNKDNNGQWICVCGFGNGFNLLMEMTGKSFKEIAGEVDQIIGNKPDVQQQQVRRLPAVVRKTMSELKPIANTWTEYYLRSRGIEFMPTMSVNHCEGVPLFNESGEKTGNYDAMVATVTDALSLERLQVHYTYLDGCNKICRKVRNLTDTDFKMPVVRLMDAEKTLGIAEGIETALSAHDKYGVPAWATINSGFMKKFRAPRGVTELWIFADNDKSATGHAAAFECARANLGAKNDVNRVVIMWPREHGDFNDLEDKDDIEFIEYDR